ncbi:hypothetical protein APASM_1120 [Actinosynnema pretiosum subsp. pretiosum]|nr:hypothetical protein APASM_1120 [Actinosynnema pretiosum subsp. pretiosum]
MNLPRTSLGTVSARKAGAAPLTHAEDEETNEVFEPDMHDWADELADEEDSGPASYPDSRPGVVEFKDGQDEDESASAEVPSSRDGSEPGGYEQANDLPAVKDPFEDWGVEAWGAWKRRNAVVAQQYRPDFLAALARKASEGDEIAARRLADLKLPAPPLRQLAG